MNHKAIVVKQMNEEAAQLRTRLAELEAGIRVLGGVSKAPASPVQRRRGPGKASGAKTASTPRKQAVNGPVPPLLQAEIDRIKADPKLKGIQVAQAVRKAKVAFYKAAPARPEGAVLSEAAAG